MCWRKSQGNKTIERKRGLGSAADRHRFGKESSKTRQHHCWGPQSADVFRANCLYSSTDILPSPKLEAMAQMRWCDTTWRTMQFGAINTKQKQNKARIKPATEVLWREGDRTLLWRGQFAPDRLKHSCELLQVFMLKHVDVLKAIPGV